MMDAQVCLTIYTVESLAITIDASVAVTTVDLVA